MSLAPIHFPQHIFTSTMTDETGRASHHDGGINIYIILLTAILFFTVLAWFNFALAFYGTVTSTDPDHKDETLSTLGFAIMWTIIAAAIYYTMEYYNVLESGGGSGADHPLLRGEGRAPVDVAGGEYLGAIDMGAV